MSTTDTSTWQCSVSTATGTPTASLTVAINGGTPQPFVIKGVCYSPCPVGASNAIDPNLGDFFWDTYSGPGYTITSWQQTWTQDLALMKQLGINTIRVYSFLDTQLADASTIYTHQNFLNACYEAGIFVIVGIPLPSTMFCTSQGVPQAPYNATWWTNNLTTTVTEVANHPAVLGFIIANEVDDGSVDTYSSPNATHWWSQVQAMATLVKNITTNKLVGIANHDDPGICANAATYMATCTDIDFWGVNSYQPASFQSVFGGGSYKTGYALLTGAALKPVIITEYGFPSTSRLTADTLTPSAIYYNDDTQNNVAQVLGTMIPAALAEPLNLGVCYFEFCDEWWNQSAYTITAGCPDATGPNAPAPGNGGSFGPFDITTQNGGPIACGFPNYYWDNDGFGLYAIGAGQGRTPSQPWNSSANAPALPLDLRTPRSIVIDALANAYGTGYAVQANIPWQNTGIVINSQSKCTISYQAGSWTADPATNNGQPYNANGCPGIIATQQGYTMLNVNMGALIGYVGSQPKGDGTDAPVFLVGNGPTTVPVTTTGNLWLCINDDLLGKYGAGLTDNSGSIVVNITQG